MSYPVLYHGGEDQVFKSYSTERDGVMIGGKLLLPDGRIFRYTHCGSSTALVVGSLNQAQVHTTDQSGEPVATMAAGVTVLTGVDSTSTSPVADQLKFGYVYTDNATTLPMMQIKSNTKITADAETGTITLFTPTPTIIASGNTLCYFENPWEDIIVIPASAPTAIPVGICKIALTESYWGWVQTQGPTTALYDSATTSISAIGVPVGPQAAGGGAVSGIADSATDTVLIVGTSLALVEGNGEQTPIFLTLD